MVGKESATMFLCMVETPANMTLVVIVPFAGLLIHIFEVANVQSLDVDVFEFEPARRMMVGMLGWKCCGYLPTQPEQ